MNNSEKRHFNSYFITVTTHKCYWAWYLRIQNFYTYNLLTLLKAKYALPFLNLYIYWVCYIWIQASHMTWPWKYGDHKILILTQVGYLSNRLGVSNWLRYYNIPEMCSILSWSSDPNHSYLCLPDQNPKNISCWRSEPCNVSPFCRFFQVKA